MVWLNFYQILWGSHIGAVSSYIHEAISTKAISMNIFFYYLEIFVE